MRKFICKTLLYALPIILPIAVYAICISPHIHGDLGKLGQYTFSDDYVVKPSQKTGTVNNVNYNDTIRDGILVIGDSFSQPNGEKYSEFLSAWSTEEIYNLHSEWGNSPFERFIFVAKRQLVPKIVIIETVERSLSYRLLSTHFTLSPQEMIHASIVDTVLHDKHGKHTNGKSLLSETSMWVKRYIDKSLLSETSMWVKRCINYPGFENPVRYATLYKPMYNCEGDESSLYYYEHDLKYAYSRDSLALMAAKMDSLFAFAQAHDIHLYVLIAEDKYDLYQTYIADTTHWEKTLLEDFCPLVQTPYLINSKDTLAKMAAAGVKDIYYCNDTHWSPIGAEAVAMQVAKRIMELEGDSTLFHLPQ